MSNKLAHFQSNHLDFPTLIEQLQRKLVQFVPITGGQPHPAFPATILQYYLLNEAELDSIAIYYHQDSRQVSIWSNGYPRCMNWDYEFLVYFGTIKGSDARINAKRRKLGRFIGLPDCETPIEEIKQKEDWVRIKKSTAAKYSFI